jgi:hypothetical protein
MGKRGLRCDVCELDPDLGKCAGGARELSGHGRCERCSRAAFLCGFRLRSDEEDRELVKTIAWLAAKGRQFPWPVRDRASGAAPTAHVGYLSTSGDRAREDHGVR